MKGHNTTKVEVLPDYKFLLNLKIELFQEIKHEPFIKVTPVSKGTKVQYAMDTRDNWEDHLQKEAASGKKKRKVPPSKKMEIRTAKELHDKLKLTPSF